MEAGAWKSGRESSEAGLTSLLPFIDYREAYLGDKRGDGRVRLAEVTESETVSEDEALDKRGVIFEELCAISSNIVYGSRGSEGASDTPGILLSGGERSVL